MKNLTHVRAAYEKFISVIEEAKETIEGKENVTERDDERIEAYDQLYNDVETAFDEALSVLEQ